MIVGFPGGKLLGGILAGLVGLLGMVALVIYLLTSMGMAVNDAKNIIPLTGTLPPMLGDPPSSAYPGSSANGWTPTAIQAESSVSAAGGCIAHAGDLLAFATRSYYYNNSTTIKGSDQASMTINVYVEPSYAAASAAQSQVDTARYRTCYAKQTTYQLNFAGMQVVQATTVSPLLIITISPVVAFASRSTYRAGATLRPYYDATAVMRYGRYRAIVDIGRCCQAIPLYTLQNTVDFVEQRMRLAPSAVGPSWPTVVALAAVMILGEAVAAWSFARYADEQRRLREPLVDDLSAPPRSARRPFRFRG